MSDVEKEEWAIEVMTPGLWNTLSRETQLSLIEGCIWKSEVYAAWIKNAEEEDMKKNPTAYKQYRRYLKKNPKG